MSSLLTTLLEISGYAYYNSVILQYIQNYFTFVCWIGTLYLILRLVAVAVKIYYYLTLVRPYLAREECAKTVVITGASSGIGYETAAQLYAKGATVIMLIRNGEKAREAVKRIKQRYPEDRCPVGRLFAIYLDLTDETSIHNAVYHILHTVDRVDVLVNNAGIGSQSKLTRVGPNRAELVMQSNFFGHVFLTLLLLPAIQASSGRVINVSSLVYNYCNLPIDDLNFRHRRYNGFTAYANSKCCLIMMNRYLSSIISSERATFYSVDPGIVATPIGDYFLEHLVGHRLASLIQPLARSVYAMIGKTTVQGCQTILKLCTKPLAKRHNGELFENCSVSQCQTDFIRDLELCTKLWHNVVVDFYPGQTDLLYQFDFRNFDRLAYARIIKPICYEVESNDDTLTISSSDCSLPGSASCCEQHWSASDEGSDEESSATSLFPDPRDEEDWDAMDVSQASLRVHSGSYQRPPDLFTEAELQFRDPYFKRSFSDSALYKDESDIEDDSLYTSSELPSYTSSICSHERIPRERPSLERLLPERLSQTATLPTKAVSEQNLSLPSSSKKEEMSDDNSVMYLFPRSLTFDDGSAATYSSASLSQKDRDSSDQSGRFLSDDALFSGLMKYQSERMGKGYTNTEAKKKWSQIEQARSRKQSAAKSSNNSDPFADFNVDEQSYGRYVNTDWMKLSEQYGLTTVNMPEFTKAETSAEPSGSSGRARTKSKLKKRWNSMKKLFQRSSK